MASMLAVLGRLRKALVSNQSALYRASSRSIAESGGILVPTTITRRNQGMTTKQQGSLNDVKHGGHMITRPVRGASSLAYSPFLTLDLDL